MLRAGTGISVSHNPRTAALEACAAAMTQAGLAQASGAIFFATSAHGGAFPLILRTIGEQTKTREVVGCSSIGVISSESEVESGPALSVLVFGGSMSLKQLAEIEQVKPPTMVRIVRGLVEQRLATSRIDREDARKVHISASARGRAVMLRARSRRVEALARMLTAKSKAERTEIANAVRILRELRVSPKAT